MPSSFPSCRIAMQWIVVWYGGLQATSQSFSTNNGSGTEEWESIICCLHLKEDAWTVRQANQAPNGCTGPLTKSSRDTTHSQLWSSRYPLSYSSSSKSTSPSSNSTCQSYSVNIHMLSTLVALGPTMVAYFLNILNWMSWGEDKGATCNHGSSDYLTNDDTTQINDNDEWAHLAVSDDSEVD